MAQIKVLGTEISNKIAAGEVVERPASVVKELVENSIDAGADAITVEIKNGGVSLICVTDNGSGISADDVATAFLRHATSKISTAQDLEAIFTLGFRGEALSSIGAVAKVSVYSKRTCDEVGTVCRCLGGEIGEAEPYGCPVGTTVEVRDLFYNTPARMKFLKRDATEASYISDLITRYILVHPEISFKFINNGKQVLYSAGDNSIKNAVYTVYGKDYANALVPVDYEIDGLRIYGMIGKGGIARPNRNFQSFFVNKRYIKSPLIIRAVEEAYKNQIMIGKFPVAILNIEVNPAKIDINVHPTKLEVKFSEEKAIYELVYYGVKNALYTPTAAERTFEMPEKKSNFEASKGEQIKTDDLSKLIGKQDYKTRFNPFELPKDTAPKKEAAAVQTKPEVKTEISKKEECVVKTTDIKPKPNNEDVGSLSVNEPPSLTVPVPKEASAVSVHDALSHYRVGLTPKQDILKEPAPLKSEVEVPAAVTIDLGEVTPAVKSPDVRVVGQVFNTYIIAEADGEMIVCDQHAAHERLKFEELKKSMEQSSVYSQIMLEPVMINASPRELDVFVENEELFLGLGFDAEPFGKKQIIVRSCPSDLDCDDCEELVLSLLTELMDSKKQVLSARQERFIYTVACKAAIKANMVLSADEMKKLVQSIISLDGINTCPHGRPIIMKMTKYELEKQFKRIQ